MALQKSGVQLVAENESGFLGAMGRAQKAVQGFEGTAGKTTPTLSGLSFGSLTLATALGGALVSAASAAVSGFFNLAKSAFSVTAQYENLSVSLQTLLAREIKTAGLTSDMGQAFDMAAPAARELLGWIEELAIKSPFDQAGVAAAYQTLQVYGFLSLGTKDVADAQAKGVVSAQRLTEALINQAAVSTRGSETMGLVSYALGQIRTSGTLLMQDLRQLTNAGVDVNSILGEMGFSLQDVGKKAINSDEFILKFTESIERDLGGAAARQAGTLSGLANSLSDLGKKYLREFFGPINEGTGKIGGILGAVQPILQKFVDTLMNENVLKGVQTFGLLLGDGLSGGISALSNVLNGLVDTFAKPFTTAANNAFGWGANIIIQLAQGIINAAGSILISAINFVGGILANWFSPGSPPKVAPGLVLWGQAAMGEFLHGFTTADFDVLKGIQQPLQSALQVMLQAGDIDAQGLADTYAEITAGLAEALANGSDPSEIFAKIADEAGQFGPELAELAKQQFNLAGGVEAVKQAEDNLAAARKAEENAGLQAAKLTQEYNDLLRGGADDATLQAKLAEINAAETAKDVAGQQADEAETQLDIAKDNLDVMEEQVKLQQELVNQLIELARLQAQAIPPITPDPAAAGGGGGAGGGAPGLPTISLPDPGEAVQSFLDTIIQKIKDAAAAMFQPILDAWNNMVAAVLAAWDNFINSLNASGLLAQLQGIWDSLVTLAGIGLSILTEFINRGLEAIWNIWNTHRAKVEQIWGQLWHLVQSVAGGILGLIVSNIDQRLQEAVTFFESNRQTITNIIEGFWSNYETVANLALTNVLGFVSDRLTTIQGLWDEYGPRILEATDRIWDTVADIFWHYLGEGLKAVETILGTITEFWDKHGKSVQAIIGFYLGYVAWIFDSTLKGISAVVTFIFEFIAGFLENNAETIKAIISAQWDFITGIFQAAVDIIGGIIDFMAGVLTGDFELMKTGLSEIWQGLWDAIGVILTAAWASITGVATVLWEFLKGAFLGIKTTLTEIWTATWASIQEKLEAGHAKLSEIWDSIKEKASEVWSAITEFVSGKIEEVKEFITAKTNEIKSGWDTFWDNVKLKSDEIIAGIKAFVEERLQTLFANMGLDLDTMRTRWSEIWEDVKEIAAEIWDRIYEKISTAMADAKQWVIDRMTELHTTWTEIWDTVSEKATEIWDTIYTTISEKVSAAKQWVIDRVGELQTWWNTTWGKISDKITEVWDAIFGKVQTQTDAAKGHVETQIGLLKLWWDEKWGLFRDKIVEIWDGIVAKVGEKVQQVYDDVTGKIDEILTTINGKIEEFKTMGADLINGMKEGVLGAVGDLITAVTKAIEDAIAAAKGALGIESPSKVFATIGHNVMFGLAEGITKEKRAPVSAISDTINAMINPPLVSQAAGNTNNYNNMSVNFNNNVSGGIDVAALDQHILRVVSAAFKR